MRGPEREVVSLMLDELFKPAERIRRGGGWRRAWACLLAVALALSLAPATAVAQPTPPSVVSVELDTHTDPDNPAIVIEFDRLVEGGNKNHFTVVVDGEEVTSFSYAAGGGSKRGLVFSKELSEKLTEGVVTVSYSVTVPAGIQPNTIEDGSVGGNLVEDFRWVVGVGPIPTEAEVYAALGSYFSGTTTLSGVESVVRAGEGHSYYEELSDVVESGGLSEILPAGRTKWGTDESSGWHQVGTPSVRPGPSDTCGGNTVPGGVQRPPTGQKVADRSEFFWACSGDGQWVPVKTPEPGVDFTAEADLNWTRVGTTGCMYGAVDPLLISYDEDGQPRPGGTQLWRVSRDSDTGQCKPPWPP